MPPLETLDRHQTATLWPLTGLVDNFGERAHGTPREIEVRWVWARNSNRQAQSNAVAHDATVITEEELTVGSLLWLGTLDEWYSSSGSVGTAVEGATGLMHVISSTKTTDLKHRFTRYESKLARNKNRVT
jgi:hypothetical protein